MFLSFALAALALAQAAELKPVARGEVVFKDENIVIEKHIGAGKATLHVLAGGDRFKTCSITYPLAVGARVEEGSLAYIPREAAKICHYALPEIQQKVYGGPLKGLVRALGGGKVLGPPIHIEFVTDEELKAILVRQRYSPEEVLDIIDRGVCFAETWRAKEHVIRCRTKYWTDPSFQANFKLAFVHEMVHFALEPGGRTPIVSWVNEGLANHIAYRLDFASALNYRLCDARRGHLRHYTKGYSCGAALLYYAVKYWDLDLQALALDLVDGKGGDPKALDRLFNAHIKNRHAIPEEKTITADALWHQCLKVPAKLRGCQGGAPHVDTKGGGYSDPGCKWCRELKL